MLEGNKIQKKVEVEKFLSFIREYKKEQIECTIHTFFRLSEKQRKIYTCDELRTILTEKRPFLVGLQYSGNYAVFYKHQSKNLKIIVDLTNTKVKIVTFFFIENWQIPII